VSGCVIGDGIIGDCVIGGCIIGDCVIGDGIIEGWLPNDVWGAKLFGVGAALNEAGCTKFCDGCGIDGTIGGATVFHGAALDIKPAGGAELIGVIGETGIGAGAASSGCDTGSAPCIIDTGSPG
jgi:hypothetical protein